MHYVVRSDFVGGQPYWLRLHQGARLTRAPRYDVTRDPYRAQVFVSAEVARKVADDWSDVPGLWRVVVRPTIKGKE